MDQENLQEVREFANTWKDYVPNFPKMENPSTKQIRDNLGFLPIRVPAEMPHEAMLKEVKALRTGFVSHREGGNHRGWRSLCLHGLSSVHTENHDRYGYADRESAPYDWTDISKFCPVSTRFFREQFGYAQYDRIRFMLLEPGGYILPHEDVEWKQLSAVNLAINNPPGVSFVMENWGTVPFSPGTVNMLAVGNKHMVYNQSDEDRFHIIVHGVRSGTWDAWIKDSYRYIVQNDQ
jgi:hypothetical protein